MMDLTTTLTLCGFSFLAGFIDAIIGGGGLIQTPAMLFTLPQYPIPTLIGTTKLPSLTGSLMGAFQYTRRVAVVGRFIGPAMVIAFCASWLGSWTLTRVPNSFMKPFALVILVAVFIYTLFKKDFGQHPLGKRPVQQPPLGQRKSGQPPVDYVAPDQSARDVNRRLRLWAMGAIVGFYDGFFGPGTGSFLVLGFIVLLGFDFLKANAHAKLMNAATNLASVLFFSSQGKLIYALALPMAVASLSGAFLGARLAILKGNQFVRLFFLLVVATTIVRFGLDIYRTLHG